MRSIGPMEPKDRLKHARNNASLSRATLGQLAGFAASTVAAHENGQNNIKPDAALAYAAALKVSPEWILYGTSTTGGALVDLSDPSQVTQVPIFGRVEAGTWREGDFRAWGVPSEGFLPILRRMLPPVRDLVENAFGALRVMEPTGDFAEGDYVVVARPMNVAVRTGDYVVAQRFDFARQAVETAIYIASGSPDELTLTGTSKRPGFDRVLHVKSLERENEDQDEDMTKKTFVVGAVLASLSTRRRGHGGEIWRE